MNRFEILTLVPEAVRPYLHTSVLGRATQRGAISVTVTDIRDYAAGKHRVTDDLPYGGGPGMVMKMEPLTAAIGAARERAGGGSHVLLTSPRGRRFDQVYARELVAQPGPLVLVCGRYEGVDERVLAHVDGLVSVGDFVMTGGELAAMSLVDAVARLLPGVLGNEASAGSESFGEDGGLLEYPQYTRPPSFEGTEVPAVLLSGDHSRIARWRRWQSLRMTRRHHPERWEGLKLSEADRALADEEEPL